MQAKYAEVMSLASVSGYLASLTAADVGRS
jgi:hypothetical protein